MRNDQGRISVEFLGMMGGLLAPLGGLIFWVMSLFSDVKVHATLIDVQDKRLAKIESSMPIIQTMSEKAYENTLEIKTILREQKKGN